MAVIPGLLVVALLFPLVGACGGGGSSLTTIITVQGRIVDRQGFGRAGNLVTVPGGPTHVSGSDGRFTIPSVFVPYTLVVQPGHSLTMARVYVGLRRSDPTISFDHPVTSLGVGSVTGTVAASGGPTELLLTEAVGHPHRVFASTTDSAGAFLRTLSWQGPSSTTATLRALRYTADTSGLPASYAGYGVHSVAVHNGLTTIGQSIALSPVVTGTIAGTITAPPGGSPAWVVDLRWSAHDRHRFVAGQSPFSVLLPDIADLKFDVWAEDGDDATWGAWSRRTDVALGTTNLTLDVPVVAQVVTPASNELIDLQTVLSADDLPGRVYQFSLSPGYTGLFPTPLPSGPVRPMIYIFTDSEQAAIPDLGALGLSLPADTPYQFNVSTWGPYNSMDDAVGPQGMRHGNLDGAFSTFSPTVQVFTAP